MSLINILYLRGSLHNFNIVIDMYSTRCMRNNIYRKHLKIIISIVTAILRCNFIKLDKFEENFCAENMHLQATYIQGSGYIKLPLSDSMLLRV